MDPIEDLGFVKVDLLGRLERCRASFEPTMDCDDPMGRANRDDDTSDENTTLEAVLVAIIKAGPRLSGDARRRIRAIVEEGTTDASG